MVSSLNCVARRQSALVAGDSCAPSLVGAVCLRESDSFTAKASWHQRVVRITAVCGHRDPAQACWVLSWRGNAASRYILFVFCSVKTGLCSFNLFFSRPAWLLLQMKLKSSSRPCSAASHWMVLNHSSDAPEPENFRLKIGTIKVPSFLHLACQFKQHAVWDGYVFFYYLYTLYSATSCPKT